MAADETLNDENSLHKQTTNIIDKLENTCIRKHKEAVELHEWEVREEERKRLFLGLHIDRRPE
jgi:hypothetical protein